MCAKKKNLSDVSPNQNHDFGKSRIGIVKSEWNPEITSALETAAVAHLLENDVEESNIIIHSVPGAFELPLAAKLLLQNHKLDAVICIGCVIQGDTKHNDYINHAVAKSISALSLMSSVPVIYGVLTPNTMKQALERAGGKHGNKGVEAASTALKMIALKKGLESKDPKIGF